MMVTFALETYRPGVSMPLRSADRDDFISFDPDVTSMQVSTALPGGFLGLTIGLGRQLEAGGVLREFGALPRSVRLRHFGHVRLLAGQQTIFQGRVTQRVQPGQEVTSVIALGYSTSATSDQPFYSTDTTLQSAGKCIAAILIATAPTLLPGPSDVFVDSLVSHSLSEFNEQTPGQILDRLAKEVGFDAAVWEQGLAWFRPRAAPPSPDYIVTFDPATMTWTEPSDETVGQIAVSYTDAATGNPARTAAVVDTTFVDRFGIDRRAVVPGGTMTAVSAQQFATAELARRNHIVPAVGIALPPGRGLTLPGGRERQPWLIRAGQWVRVADYEIMLPIVKTQYDANANSVQVDLGDQPADWTAKLNALLDAQRAAKTARNLNTGAPA